MAPFDLDAELEAQDELPTFEERPKIAWGGGQETLNRFPERWELELRCQERNDSPIAAPMSIYLEAIALAKKRIWILDPHFDAVGIEALREGLIYCQNPEKLRICIVGSRAAPTPVERQKLITHGIFDRVVPSVEWHVVPDGRSYPFAHDRFCIIDNELFHFGGTIGGATAQLTAATSGWSATERRADQFFVELWELLSS